MNNVTNFTGVTRLDIDPDRVLESSINKLEGVIVIGYDKAGNEYFSSSYADGGDVIWLLERAKLSLLSQVDNE